MCGSSDERHPVPSAGEHGTVKATNSACANDCNVFEIGCVQVKEDIGQLNLMALSLSDGFKSCHRMQTLGSFSKPPSGIFRWIVIPFKQFLCWRSLFHTLSTPLILQDPLSLERFQVLT
jgi:hypothetical protein